VDVVLVGVDFFEDDVGMVLGAGVQKSLEVALNTFVEDAASVFGWPHQMVVAGEYAVAHPPVHGHGYSIPACNERRKLADAGRFFSPRAYARGIAGEGLKIRLLPSPNL
jgi:hypothetical protein